MSRRLKIIAFATTLVGFAVMAGAYDLGFERWPPQATLTDGQSTALYAPDVQACFKARALALLGDAASNHYWQACRQRLIAYRALEAFEVRSVAVAGGGVIGFLALFGFAFCLRIDRPSFKVTRGSRLHIGTAGLRAFARANKSECRIHGRGVELLPPIAISRDRETRHFLILGSVGGGKTQTMLNLILGAIARDDTVLVLDTKGDMMAGLPGGPTLIAPHDRRSQMWDIASDCRIKQDAHELAARFIPASPDPMWSEAAREIFVACVVHLQATKNCLWDWADLTAAVNSDTATLAQFAKDHNPNALRLLDQPDSKTTHSILTTFRTHMRIVSVLAEAWPDNLSRRFSIRDWLKHEPKRAPLILQHDPGYPELSRIWIGSMLSVLASAVGSPSFTESSERKVWLFLDEFPQLPAIHNFPMFLELGRSKGVAVVIGAQDTAQIRAVYGADQAKAWFGMTGTKIITRINASESAEDISRIIGEQEIERPNRSVTRASGRSSVTESLSRETRRVVTASELATHLGPTDYGVRVLFLGLGRDVYELELPYITLPQRRPPTLPADWTRTPPPPPQKGSNGKTLPTPSPVRLTQDLADLIRQTRR
jgi:Type IV secretion-system coupling protein DNA-binding domain